MINNKNLSMNTPPQNIVVPFLLLTFGITWTFWWAIVIANKYGFLEYGTPMMMLPYTGGVVAPAIVSIALIMKSKQMTGKQLVKTICDFKQPLLLYAVVIIIAILTYIIPLLINKATVTAPLYMSILLMPFDLIGGGLEEIGWRFLLQPTLEKKTNFILATIITAIIWALWHLPLFFMAGTNQFTWSFFDFTILALGMSFVLAAIYRVSGSVLLCILFHTLWNAIGESISINMDIVSSTTICVVLIAISFILMKILPRFTNIGNSGKKI